MYATPPSSAAAASDVASAEAWAAASQCERCRCAAAAVPVPLRQPERCAQRSQKRRGRLAKARAPIPECDWSTVRSCTSSARHEPLVTCICEVTKRCRRTMRAMEEKGRPIPPPVMHDVVVDVPGWQEVKPRIPDTQQRRTLEKQRSVREIVFGVQDGILTTLGIITGVGVAEGDRSAVFISGFLAVLAGSLSMAVGEYLGGKSEREVVQATIAMEKA